MESGKKETIEIPFGAKDSELYKFEYTIPDGYEAEIKDGKVIMKKKESEDERIRKYIIEFIKLNKGVNLPPDDADRMLSYLEKHKESSHISKTCKENADSFTDVQNPAEWSEEDERAIDRACVALRAYSNGNLPEFLPSELLGYADRLQSLTPNPHWKPSEEQMKTLKSLPGLLRNFKLDTSAQTLEVLYEQLKKL